MILDLRPSYFVQFIIKIQIGNVLLNQFPTHVRSMHGKHGRVGARAAALAPGDVVRLERDLASIDRPRHATKAGAGRIPVVPVDGVDGGQPALQFQLHLEQAAVLLHPSGGRDRQNARIQLQLHGVTITGEMKRKFFLNNFFHIFCSYKTIVVLSGFNLEISLGGYLKRTHPKVL